MEFTPKIHSLFSAYPLENLYSAHPDIPLYKQPICYPLNWVAVKEPNKETQFFTIYLYYGNQH